MTLTKMRTSCVLLSLLFATAALADGSPYELGGHTKFRLNGRSFGDESLFRDAAGSTALDVAGELRLNFTAKQSGWGFHSDYQLIALRSEFLPLGLLTDDRRLFDLTSTLHDRSENSVVHRLDRFWAGYTGDKTVVRFGRQALSWGNGLFFAPMDLVNPFDPTAIDTEYKTGDDMLYLQYLRDSGDDLQGAVVFRRDPLTGDVEADHATLALKYHGFAGEAEYDLLVAEDHDNTVIGVGGARSVGGAVLRGDVVVTGSPTDTTVEVVTNVSYSWAWGGKNVSGTAEYYYDGDDSHYMAGNLTIEMSPLWTLTPTVISNIDDPSALLQIVTGYSLSVNMTFLGSLNVPLGAKGTEFGGPESRIPNRYLSFEYGVFAQLAWYF
jgi:hypothetical protein